MKRLSISLPALALALALALPGATSVAHPTITPPILTKENTRLQLAYYWYSWPADSYIDHQTLIVEELEWWIVLGGVPVDTNPVGGTLIARGYLTNAYPHTAFPSQYLYAHYTN